MALTAGHTGYPEVSWAEGVIESTCHLFKATLAYFPGLPDET